MDLEPIFSHWKTITAESKISEQFNLTNQSDWLEKIENIKNDLIQLEATADAEEIRPLLRDILRKQIFAKGLLLVGSIINDGDSSDLEKLKKLIIEIKNTENFDNSWPITLYDIIKNKFPKIQNLFGAEKLCLNTLGDLFGKLHSDMPVYNACSRNVLESLGFNNVHNYQDFQKSFENFKQDYQSNIGKISEVKMDINTEIDQLFNYFDKDKKGKNFLSTFTKPPKYWIWSTTPQNWNVVQEKSIWASKREKISKKIHYHDKVIFYVTTTGEFQGIYEFSGDWYDTPSTIWRDTADQDVLKEIKLNLIATGKVRVYDIAKSLDFFPKTDDKKLINIILQGGSGYPSNKGKSISEKDYLTILNSMSSDPSTMPSSESMGPSKELVRSILWKKLTKTDFDAINAQSNQDTTVGGGARHIALGTNNTIDVAGFLDVELQDQLITKNIDVYFIDNPKTLTFRRNPERRGGEWVIADQASNRHPAWDPQNQFPTTYDENNAPIIYITKTDVGHYHTRFILGEQVSTLDIPNFISDKLADASPGDKGVNHFKNTQLDDESISILNELQLHHNILLYGPPGTGKTHFMQQLFSYFENGATPSIEFLTSEVLQPFRKSTSTSVLPLPSISKWLTFHQSYSYEEFLLGLRPEPQGSGMTLKPKAGVLLEISENIKKTNGSAILFIDEINRANISNVFGEFITAIEPDKRLNPNGQPNPGKTIPINLTYLGKNDEVKFSDDSHTISNPYSFPYHIYVVASMNSLDRSVTPIDSALARRFFRINIEPNYHMLQKQLGLDNSNFDTPTSPEEVSIMLLKRVNLIISAVLGDDFQFGHSYFWNVNGTEDEKWKSVAGTFEGNIYPQLKELLRSQPETLATILKINEGTTPPIEYPYKRNTESQKLISKLDMEISPTIVNTPFSSLTSEKIKEALRFLAKKET